MSLGTRLTLKTAVLVLAVVVVAGAALWGLGGLNRDLDAALAEYDRLEKSYALMNMVEQARAGARGGGVPNAQRVREPVLRALLRLEKQQGVVDPDRAELLIADLRASLAALEGVGIGQPVPLEAVGPLNTSVNRLLAEIEDTSRRIEQIEAQSQRHRALVVKWIAITAGLAALLAVAVGIWQYAAVMRPLRRLQRGVERLSSGDFTDRLSATGDREFVRLADDFNRMADELAGLYRDLEEKVRLRSAQLAQSERLASVGFLAAGVAHEINNPLAIIAGEAELALGGLTEDADTESRKTLTAIRDEAFRCKGITQKLLSLARPGSGERQAVALDELAQAVATLVRSLPQHDGRQIVIDPGSAPCLAQTNASQVKQVLLNLVINALEATEPGAGVVRLETGRGAAGVWLAVHDNGEGLSGEQIARVFEPFYTEKNTPSTPGLGLGLSISHAIIEDLGGRLTAVSDGPGKGSTFTIELPA